MCGILATMTLRGECRSRCSQLPGCLSSLQHRGPHAQGAASFDLGWCWVHLSMSRLKITDQSDLAVPMGWHGVHVAYNGEIYNCDELRSRLTNGEAFDTRCDAEVLVRAWLAWGPSALHELNGMFAFVLVDTRRGMVAMARDRAGEKPLYWRVSSGCLAVASEAKALPGRLEECSCDDLEAFEADLLEETPWAGVKRLLPGSISVLERPAHLAAPPARPWWSLSIRPQAEPATPEAAAEELQPILEDAIRIRARAELPAACMLSGGLDSAIIQAVAHCPTCYTVTFPGVADNLTPALGATRGAQLFPVSFGLAEAQQALPRVAYHLDTPAMWTAVCQWWMMQAIAADGFRICLSGEGADELFLGYSRYRILWWLEQARQDERLHSYGPMLDHVVGSGAGAMARMIQRGYGLVSSARATEVIKRFDDPALSLPRRMAKIDFSTGMQVLLRMADRMAAAHSLENRSPFLDHRVIELAARLPDSALIDAGRSKAVLIEVARRLDVPEEILQEKTKRGLYLPWNTWHPKAQTGPRGAWDRRHFHNAMLHAWREAFAGRRSQACDAAASEEDQQACDTPRS